eukprot:TRINITY_DN1142_c0_g1_i1.p1 TRINITY_DN1142_c0_g1~~TRINITY_DN1142_c0_g1_i1.p1  ORF type:complete len:419 (+),score=74.21 TRINITY_DN1142_c0_g1_i1:704-1960(+)
MKTLFCLLLCLSLTLSLDFTYEKHDYINPWTGAVAWTTTNRPTLLSMEWIYLGVEQVLPTCSGSFDWSPLDNQISDISSRNHQVIVRPIFYGPGYGSGSYVPSDMPQITLSYEGDSFVSPDWSSSMTRECVFKFIDAFCDRYKSSSDIAYVQMGLVGLWGEHHIDSVPYTSSNFPSASLQQDIILRWISGMGSSSSSISLGISLDSTQEHGAFVDNTLDGRRFHFFDDTLLIENHDDPSNWRQEAVPTTEREARSQYGYGGEVFWGGCNSDSSWAVSPNDCGNGETMAEQGARLKLNYFLGSNAFETSSGRSNNQILTVSKSIGYDFWIRSISQGSTTEIEVCNEGVAYSPYLVQVCVSSSTSGENKQCQGDLSTLAPGGCTIFQFTLSGDTQYYVNLESLQRRKGQSTRWIFCSIYL